MSLRIRVLTSQVLFFFCFGSALPSICIADEEYADGMVRAAVIFGLLRFTEWPEQQRPLDSLQLCSLGTSPAIEAIQSLEKLPNIGKKLLLYQKKQLDQKLEDCHVIVLGVWPKKLDSLPIAVLVICDNCADNYQHLWMISLMRMHDRIQFDVNLDQVEDKKLKLSASLLELAARCSSKRRRIRGCDG